MARTRMQGTTVADVTPAVNPAIGADEPIVEQITEGETTMDVALPVAGTGQPVNLIDDPIWLRTETVQHKLNCPMITAPMNGTDGHPGKLQRIETSDVTEPRSADRPIPRTFKVIACLDCGQRARIQREFNPYA